MEVLFTKQNGPKRSSLVANLLNRVDGKSLAIKSISSGGIEYYLESDKTKHLKANKESLANLNYDELVILLNGTPLQRKSMSLSMFKLEFHLPERIRLEKPKEAVVVRSYKQSDEFTGTAKQHIEEIKPTSKEKRKRI